MASNKNQHFVPRCYLKPFTMAGAGAAINLFNIDRSRCIESAPVKNQCSRDYFYGEDLRVERALQGIEGIYSRVLAEIHEPSYTLSDEHRQLLRRFALLQHLRTEAASRRSVEVFGGVESVVGSTVENFKPTIREAVEMAMRVFVDEMSIVDDLKVCLMRNRTTIPFVSSDDPAILTNRWHFEDRRAVGMAPGLLSSGALILLPLSSQVLCLAYDGDVYSVPHTGGWVEVRRERDMQAFNQHQFLNCRANIYFRDWGHRQCVMTDYASASSKRPKSRHRVNYAIFDHVENGSKVFRAVDKASAGDHDNALIHIETISPKPDSWPVQITWRTRGAIYTNGTAVGYVRNSATRRDRVNDFRKEKARL